MELRISSELTLAEGAHILIASVEYTARGYSYFTHR